METNISDYDPASLTLFKSYYVVWKRDCEAIHFVVGKKFKSYYVVWKQYQSVRSSRRMAWFKSYYVVWKPDSKDIVFFGKYRLNRTM